MRRLIRSVALLSTVALLSPEYGFAEQPSGRIAAAAGAPNTVVWTSREPSLSPMSARPGEMFPTIKARGEAPGDLRVERPGSSEIEKDGGADIKALVNEGSFLLPTWDRGFWLMPPGGLTRFLIPAPGFVNPEEAFAADSAILESG